MGITERRHYGTREKRRKDGQVARNRRIAILILTVGTPRVSGQSPSYPVEAQPKRVPEALAGWDPRVSRGAILDRSREADWRGYGAAAYCARSRGRGVARNEGAKSAKRGQRMSHVHVGDMATRVRRWSLGAWVR
jgi:hypothetical protein